MEYWDYIKCFGSFPESFSFSVTWVYLVTNRIVFFFFKKSLCMTVYHALYLSTCLSHCLFLIKSILGCCLFTVPCVYAFHSFAVVEARPPTFTQTHTYRHTHIWSKHLHYCLCCFIHASGLL